MNFFKWEWQVSDDEVSCYALRFDGVDWKGTINQYTAWELEELVHTNIPNAGTPPAEKARQLYYRVRAVTKLDNGSRDTESGYSSTQNATTIPFLAFDEPIPPLNGAISNLAGNSYAQEAVTFSLGDDTHGGLYGAGYYSGLAGMRIWRRINGSGNEPQMVGDTGNATDTTFLDKTTEDNVAYDFGLSAYDVNGNESRPVPKLGRMK